jgi:phospholipase C
VAERCEVTPAATGTFGTLPQPGTTYAVGQPHWVPDPRFPALLPNGPFQITRYADFMAHVGDPVHRFFQMWQQFDGGRMDLFTWVGLTSGEGSRQRDDLASSTNQGAVAMGFYNMSAGDAPGLRRLAESFAISDNHHQPVMGGTGANFIALSTGHAGSYQVDGQRGVPPANQIENPDPRPGANNWYTQSGYTSGSYVNCSDPSQPGVKAIRDYIASLPYQVFNAFKHFDAANCAEGTYYLVNNYAPGYSPTGEKQPLGPTSYTLPPQTASTIADALSAKGITWRWYSGGRTADGIDKDKYCSICDPLTHATSIMTSDLKRNLVGVDALERDLADAASFPSVAFVIPPNAESGHPGYSTVARFESFVTGLVERVQANPALWMKTAVIVTTDEGGGYYDSGYVQILDFFGDGPRVSLFAISPFARKGVVDHTYTDHVSILKFIERNWRLEKLSFISRDNLPNPEADPADPYVPANRPAIGDLTTLFQF